MRIAKRLLWALALALLVMVLAVATVAADEDDEEGKGKKAPEVPIALVYPALGGLSYLGYRFVHGRRSLLGK